MFHAVDANRCKWHHATYAAFCRKYGDHATPAVGPHNWNDDIISAMRADLESEWTSLICEARQRIQDTIEFISNLFQNEEIALTGKCFDNDVSWLFLY
jgi:hypothetical protein